MLPSRKPRALFLDRDGTLIFDEGYLADPRRVRLLPGVKEALHYFKSRHCLLFLFSNQSGIGRGYFTLAQAQACNQRLMELLELGNDPFASICLAPEIDDRPGGYRKPSPRFILESLKIFSLDAPHCWMVGDKLSDVEAGLAARIPSVLLSPLPPQQIQPYLIFPNLQAFAQHLKKINGN
jgi:D-glycero-D-manno-heptose 1,7-bisphosphate phosphatase